MAKAVVFVSPSSSLQLLTKLCFSWPSLFAQRHLTKACLIGIFFVFFFSANIFFVIQISNLMIVCDINGTLLALEKWPETIHHPE